MPSPDEGPVRISTASDQPQGGNLKTTIPILPSIASSEAASRGDPMDVTTPTSATMRPPVPTYHDKDRAQESNHNGAVENGRSTNGTSAPGPGPGLGAAAAAAATQQPKVVQTAFIHKLYNMLEDQNISHLISWSTSGESFVMSPSNEFSKVLAQYFKHTNISSFVRQLNMYGFHKVSDVFQTGSPDSPLWEFKHGNGSFRRGDLMGLREIKRRASRHALIHRDSFPSGPKGAASQPGTPAEPMPDTTDVRLTNLEHSMYDMSARLARTEEGYALMTAKCQALFDGILRCHQWNNDLSHAIMALVPDPEHQLRRDLSMMQKEVARQTDLLRSFEDPHEVLLSGRQPYFSNMTLDSAPISPRQLAQDDPRRSSIAGNGRPSFFRAPMPPHLAASPRRYGSISNSASSATLRPYVPPPPPPPHAMLGPGPSNPLITTSSPPANLSRRHTSADIRLHGWQAPPPGNSPFASGHSSTQWPSSPQRTPNHGDQQLRDALASYEIRAPRPPGSRQATPPLTNDTTPSTLSVDSAWSLGAPRYPLKATDTPGPPTRRSSMASNVHSLLNPTDTMERDEDEAANEDRKRKRLQ
ncbi:HSF-type DNA-binding domain protein [Xylona heveae TC161]|uniref:HSF-type DNA-binding domain protein n=1 Tax=Xylona heveae (strain CBS 132557 / TC161) TaxID=1328760 RepID=A0A165GZC4_XYLHT|nr:HSF-type DNA-binding domain protein [Xylona heveae TC161]KZF22789.1 HSF-type DNA-binding domain protein [Xylona heveae TC161]